MIDSHQGSTKRRHLSLDTDAEALKHGDMQVTEPHAAPFYRLEIGEVFSSLQSSRDGLTQEAQMARLKIYGANELKDSGTKGPGRILWEQISSVMVLILIGAAVLSCVLDKYLEAGAIGSIVSLFVLLGFFQEYKAERAIAALRKMSAPSITGIRAGSTTSIPTYEIVPGDVILLEAGNIVPADMRLFESASLRIEEATLTGEAEPVEKSIDACKAEALSLGDRKNMAFAGTLVAHGRGAGVVVATGMNTELGKIAKLLQNFSKSQTPLQQKLDVVGKQLALLGVFVALIVVCLGALAGEQFSDLILTAISVAVAVIPEGLPAVVTFTLAIGAQRMLVRNALIRKLPAVETLGSVTVICSDKTGTLTQNKMTATVLAVANEQIDISASTPKLSNNAFLALSIGALCNDGHITREGREIKVIGDPTETSLLVSADKHGINIDQLKLDLPRIAENPFDSSRKRMSTIHSIATTPSAAASIFSTLGYSQISLVKGAVDSLMLRTHHLWNDGKIEPITDKDREHIQETNNSLARNGMRVLALAFKKIVGETGEEVAEQDLVFVGLVGIIDPPRAEVKDAVTLCKRAGIRPIMITGDHPLTAVAIGRELGISTDQRCMVGTELEHLTPAQLIDATSSLSIFARVAPEHKLRIIEALQAQGHVVAMTGDGVNDAPALKKADIGVAMGVTGTDVSKEASDMILRDDNFATIVAAVEEGRIIYDNLRRFIKFAVAGNVGKIIVMVGWPIPFLVTGAEVSAAVALLPLQLLWLNLMTDGLLGLSMGVEPAEAGVMSRKPHTPRESIWARGLGIGALWIGAYIGVVSLGVGLTYFMQGKEQFQSMMFMTIAFMQIFQTLGGRSATESIVQKSIYTNKTMLCLICSVTALQLVAIYSPIADFIKLRPLSLIDLLITISLGSSLLLLLEIEKWSKRKRMKVCSA